MKVADVSFSYQQNIATEEELLQQHATITGWAEALQKRGIEIVVVKRFHKQHSFKKNEVEYYFINDGLKGWLRPWHIPFTFLKKIKQLKADVVHVHGFMFPMQVLMLRLMVQKKTAIVLQHHGGKASQGIKGIVYGLMNNVADGFFFTSTDQANW